MVQVAGVFEMVAWGFVGNTKSWTIPNMQLFTQSRPTQNFVAQGRNGGENGQPSKLTLIDPDGQIIPIPSKVSMDLEPGSVLRIETSGGGGFGTED